MQRSCLALGVAVFLVPAEALALQQPDGTVIPTTASLQGLFNSQGETIDALMDAATTPETFIPSCELTFQVLQRNAGFQNSFGWYNVTGVKPTTAELHEFIACTDAVGTTKVLDIKSDPAWAGGEVGFYQAAGPGCPTTTVHDNVFFSEKAYNPDSSQQNPYIHLLTYNSTVTDKAFYFAWEDLLTGNDNDFDDLTMLVSGITCTGGGIPCDTGQLGVCANGILQCQSGVLECIPTIQPQTESCDGFDNDCNDLVDEGDLCQKDFVCDQGNCVPTCLGGEFPCPPGTACDEDKGLCIDVDCLMVECPAGEKCVNGDCLGPCENVVCPFGQVCQLGVCLDPCGPITCDADQICVDGVCLDKCPCLDCADGEICQMDGSCIAAACDGVTCPAGQHCDPTTGMCQDDCAGAMCPLGQICMAGQCVVDTSGQGGSGGGSSGTFATTGSGVGGGATGAGNGAGGGATGGGGNGESGSSDGCDCRTGTPSGSGQGAWLLVGLFAAIVRAATGRARSSRARRTARGPWLG